MIFIYSHSFYIVVIRITEFCGLVPDLCHAYISISSTQTSSTIKAYYKDTHKCEMLGIYNIGPIDISLVSPISYESQG